MIRTINSRLRLGPRLAASASASASASTSPFHTGAAVGRRRSQHRYHLLASCSTYNSPHPSRFFWSSSAESEEHKSEKKKKKKKNDNPPPALPIPPLTPSNISATSLLSNSTIESLKSLPEIQSTLDILYYGIYDGNENTNKQQLNSKLQRARDILQSLPQLHSSTYLISVDLHALFREFDLALECLARYNIHLQQQQRGMKLRRRMRIHLQFLKAKLFFTSGQFTHALSEYEDMLETMEQDVERQMKRKQRSERERGVSVMDGAATLTGMGLTKLLLYLTENQDIASSSSFAANEILDPIETSTDMLLESRQDALNSPQHAELAVDLGIAASISLTNLGIANCLVGNNKVESIEQWKKGLDTLDSLLGDAMHTATIIPRHKFQLMESVRARLHCNIACLLLGLVDPSSPSSSSKKLEDDTLKHASEAAKKGLDIFDELINGAKILRGEGSNDSNNTKDENVEEWERILKEEVEKKQENNEPEDVPLSSLWTDYHRCESARALGLVAHCYAQAGAAVTSEGLFQSALDASSSYPFGQSLRSSSNSNVVVVVDGTDRKGIALSSPNLALVARDVRLWYGMLCNNWEKRKGDADRLLADAEKIDKDMVFQGLQGEKKRFSGMVSSLSLFMPIDFEESK